MKPIKVLIMSVGKYKDNGTAKWLENFGLIKEMVVVLPKQFEENADSYRERGIEVYIYDEKKYINEDFEFFGFKPRNCGGVGRQGIAEAVEKYGDDYICVELDDDTASYGVRSVEKDKACIIRSKESFIKIIEAFEKFYNETGVECMGKTGATPPSGNFISNRKIFNNFIMRKGNRLNFDGFKALCSDDCRYNLYNNLFNAKPMISTELVSITFTQNQGDRKDGNAVLYNGDYSWKKSYSLKMMMPWCVEQRIKEETNRTLFRENFCPSLFYPYISLEENGKIVGRLR